MNKTLVLELLQSSKIKPINIVLEKITSRMKKSYSFYGEDALILGILERYEFIFKKPLQLSYIDIGAWRPIRGSNTYFLYKRGFFGTAVEPNPYFTEIWKQVRPKDNFLQIGCGEGGSGVMQIFHASAASNTVDPEFAKKIINSQNVKVEMEIQIKLKTLSQIIAIHREHNSLPFLLDIDIEGLDYSVLNEFSFEHEMRPMLIMVEDGDPEAASKSRSALHCLLNKNEYQMIARTVLTAIFVDTKTELVKLC